MSTRSPPRHRRIVVVMAIYGLAYLLASWLDLATTSWALERPEAIEGNVYASNSGTYVPARAWLITLVGAIVIEACLLWSLLAAPQVANRWCAHPIASFAKVYLNPWSRAVRDRAPLHMASFVIAFVALRLVAAANNALIATTGTAPLGRLVGLASHATSPTIAFWIVLGPLFYLLAIAASPMAARLIGWLAEQERRPG